MADSKRLFTPESNLELLNGWLIHAHKARDRHDLASRVYERSRYAIGIPTLITSTVVGTSVFSALSAKETPALWVAVISVIAAVLTGLQTFLDFPTRADRHRAIAAKYKAAVRLIEQLRTDMGQGNALSAEAISDLRGQFDALEEDAPVVMPKIHDTIEKRYEGASYVQDALGLYAK